MSFFMARYHQIIICQFTYAKTSVWKNVSIIKKVVVRLSARLDESKLHPNARLASGQCKFNFFGWPAREKELGSKLLF